jgi:hypothetical protein
MEEKLILRKQRLNKQEPLDLEVQVVLQSLDFIMGKTFFNKQIVDLLQYHHMVDKRMIHLEELHLEITIQLGIVEDITEEVEDIAEIMIALTDVVTL